MREFSDQVLDGLRFERLTVQVDLEDVVASATVLLVLWSLEERYWRIYICKGLG